MEILETVESVKLFNITGGGDCNLFNYGCMRDVIYPFSCEFRSRNIYGIIDEFGNGGWALTTILTGKNKCDQGKIQINNKFIRSEDIFKYSCYVGDDLGMKNRLTRQPFSVREQIEYGIHQEVSFCNDVEEIKKKFGLSEERFNRNIKHTSGERWKSSMAIGYANGKNIYCFPWMNTRYIIHLEEHIRLCVKTLLEVDAIIIIPTCRQTTLLKISKECKFLYLTESL